MRSLKDEIINTFEINTVFLVYGEEKLMIGDMLCQSYQPYGNIIRFYIIKIIKILDFQGCFLFCLKYKMLSVLLSLPPFSWKSP